MRSHSSSLNLQHFSPSGLSRSPKRRTFVPVLFRLSFLSSSRFCVAASSFYSPLKFQLKRSQIVQKRSRQIRPHVVKVNSPNDDDSMGISSFDEWVVDDSVAAYVFSSSSDGEYSDGEIVLNPLAEVDLPPVSAADDSVTMRSLTSRRYSLLVGSQKKNSMCRKEGPASHSKKQKTPTMGGLFFLPVGIFVANFVTGFSSVEVAAATVATLAFAMIGLIDDVLCVIKQHSSGLSPRLRLLLEAAVGIWFSFWLNATTLSSPYGMKMLVPLPAPLGLVCFGKFYLLLTPFCFVSMGNGVNLTDGLDGLAGGTAALALVGMSIAVLPICPELAIFGASMAGACVGFLLHNQYKASVFMGDIGSLALGGALAAMAACTGMFFPLIISSGIFVLEASSVILQVLYFKITKRMHGSGRRLFRMAPFHHHLELSGYKEPVIVSGAYAVSCMLSLFAGYIGLISA
ncbi:hypothetical protein V6N13_011363 [Hibiscus sabdariffa]